MILRIFQEIHTDQGGRKEIENALQPVPGRRFNFQRQWTVFAVQGQSVRVLETVVESHLNLTTALVQKLIFGAEKKP